MVFIEGGPPPEWVLWVAVNTSPWGSGLQKRNQSVVSLDGNYWRRLRRAIAAPPYSLQREFADTVWVCRPSQAWKVCCQELQKRLQEVVTKSYVFTKSYWHEKATPTVKSRRSKTFVPPRGLASSSVEQWGGQCKTHWILCSKSEKESVAKSAEMLEHIIENLCSLRLLNDSGGPGPIWEPSWNVAVKKLENLNPSPPFLGGFLVKFCSKIRF